MKVLPLKIIPVSSRVLMMRRVAREKVERVLRKVGRLAPSWALPRVEANDTQRAEEQKLNSSSFLQLTNIRTKMTITMRQMISITLRQRMGRAGSAQRIIRMLKLLPNRKTGIVKLLAKPTSPESPVITPNIFHPTVSSVKLPKHHSRRTPRTREVISWQTKGAVNSRQNSKCLRCSGRRTRDSRAKVGILRKGGYLTTSVMQMMRLTAMRKVVKDFSLQQGASRFWIISKKVSDSPCSSPMSS